MAYLKSLAASLREDLECVHNFLGMGRDAIKEVMEESFWKIQFIIKKTADQGA